MTGAGLPVDLWRVSGRPTRAVIDLDAFAANVRHVRDLIAPSSALMAVVKANGYGHGAVMMARTALEAGAAQLAVATVGEGAVLRAAGVTAPILVLGPIDPSEIERALSLRLSLTLADPRFAELVAAQARRAGPGPAAIHVKVDTGMHRFGATPEVAVALARQVAATPALALDGFFTHFADADNPDLGFTEDQAARFERCLADLRADGVHPAVAHAANSAATLRSRRFDYDLVRVGIALYGLSPGGAALLPAAMRPVLSIRSRIARLTDLAPGDTVSYGRAYVAHRPERAALVPIGYADGYRRHLSSRGSMGVRGTPAPVRGRVCMDQTVIGIPDGINARPGDEVIVAADWRGGGPSIDEIAALLGTIPYEVATGLASRLPRYYIRDGRLVAVDDIGGPSDLAAL